MPTLTLNEQRYSTEPGETVLAALLRQDEEIPHSCRSGVCRSCLLRATQGTPPALSQKAVKDTLRAQGYFLSCVAVPDQDLTVALPSADVVGHTRAVLEQREQVAPDIYRLVLRHEEPFPFHAGQFVTVRRPDGLRRSYSLAAPPNPSCQLELHVRQIPGGALSTWLCHEVALGTPIDLFGPEGSCFYLPGDPERPLLLIGTGTGLAPLWGIVREALAQRHTGPLRLYHGSRHAEGLYLQDELRALAAAHPNLHYTPCASATGLRADVAAFTDLPDTTGYRVYLCGHPEMVKSAQRKAFLLGASLSDLYTDPFVRAITPA